jgi:hypothetical protein
VFSRKNEPDPTYVEIWASNNDGNVLLFRIDEGDVAQFQASGYIPRNYQEAKRRLMKRPDYKGPITSKFLGSVLLK